MKTSVEKFNALNGKIISRTDLIKIRNQASDENQHEVFSRISALVKKHPEAQNFELEIDTPAKLNQKALAGSKEDHAVLIYFKYNDDSIDGLHVLEEKIIKAVKGIGEYDGHDISFKLHEGILYIYGENADAIFKAIKNILVSSKIISNIEVTLRYGDVDTDAKEKKIKIKKTKRKIAKKAIKTSKNTQDGLDYTVLGYTSKGLGAPQHTGIAEKALNSCGRLLKGYKFVKGGDIVKVKPKTKSKNQPTNKNHPKLKLYFEKLKELKLEIERNDLDIQKNNEAIKAEKDFKLKSKLWEKKNALLVLKDSRIQSESKTLNILAAISAGGDVIDIKDKKGKLHTEIADFRNISTENFVFDTETILTTEHPKYIPLFHEKTLKSRGFVFDAIKHDEDSYLASTKKHDEKLQTEYVLVTLDQLVLISDYYLTRIKAQYAENAKNTTKRELERWNNLPEDKKERFYTVNSGEALYRSLPAKVKKTISLEKYKALPWKAKESVYKFYKRHGSKRIKSNLDDKHMFASLHQMYERFINPKATMPKPRTANPEVFDYWKVFRDDLKFKLIDIDIQRKDYSETRTKGMETSFGNTNVKKALLKEYGVLVKRQNGSIINPKEIEQIETALKNIFNVIGDISEICRLFGLKVSHTGKTLVYARKAVGIFSPYHKAVASSAKFSAMDFETTLAHELAHFLDYVLGSKNGKRYYSDNFESSAGVLAKTFRKALNKPTKSNYTNSTKECLARAVEMHFAITNFGDDAILFYDEMIGPAALQTRYVDADNFVTLKTYQDTIKPLVLEFLKDVFNKSNNSLAAPRHKGIAKEALTECGRLKTGYKYVKGGEIEKIEKKKKVYNKPVKPQEIITTLKSRKDLETWLKQNGFNIVKKHTLESLFTGKKNTQYQLNFQDVGGLVLDVFGQNVKEGYEGAFKIKGLGFDEADGLYNYDNAEAFYEYLVIGNKLEELTRLPITGAEKLRKKYSNTLISKKNKKQLALFGTKNKKPTQVKSLGTVLIDVSTPTPTPAVTANEGVVSAVPLEVTPQQNTKVLDDEQENQKKPVVNKSKTSSRLMDMSFDTIDMDEGWENFMQEPAANMKLAIWGKPKNGKTSGALALANYLTKKGSVFYNFVDQGFNKSTQDLWRMSGLANKSNAEPSDIDDLDSLEKVIKEGGYRFVFIDMINDYINKEKITPQEFKDRFIKQFPKTSFILIFEVTKSGDFKGDQAWTHVVDAIVTVEDFLMENRGRYGIGHYIVWEEGLKKFNPKKYDEITGIDSAAFPSSVSV